MDVAIRGNRAGCLTMQLADQAWLFAVASGFGRIDGEPCAAAALARLRAECERRIRSERFRKAIYRPNVAEMLIGVVARVNHELFVRSAAHADYITAATSMTAVLVVRGRGYVVHAGGTAAYLAHNGGVQTLTADDTFADELPTLLARALGTTMNVDVGVTQFALQTGDVLVLLAHRAQGSVDRLSLIAHVEGVAPSEQVLVVRFDDADRAEQTRFVARANAGGVRAYAWIWRALTIGALLVATIGWAR